MRNLHFILAAASLLALSPAVAAPDAAPDNESHTGYLSSAFQLEADASDTSASLTLARRKDLGGSFGNSRFGVTASVPLDKKSDEGNLLTERGIVDGLGLEFAGRIKLGSATAPATPYEDTTETRQTIVDLGITAGVGFDEFDYRDPLTFTEADVQRTTYSAAGGFGILMPGGEVYLSTGYEYRRGYKAATEELRCLSTVSPDQCREAVFAPPERDIDHALFSSVRTVDIFGGSNLPDIALEFRVAYDVEDDVIGVELPVYLFAGGDGQPRGGIRIGWDSEEKDVTFGVFVGVPFSLTGQ